MPFNQFMQFRRGGQGLDQWVDYEGWIGRRWLDGADKRDKQEEWNKPEYGVDKTLDRREKGVAGPGGGDKRTG
jgi:hypothetical protein